jgi:hypothetical protein
MSGRVLARIPVSPGAGRRNRERVQQNDATRRTTIFIPSLERSRRVRRHEREEADSDLARRSRCCFSRRMRRPGAERCLAQRGGLPRRRSEGHCGRRRTRSRPRCRGSECCSGRSCGALCSREQYRVRRRCARRASGGTGCGPSRTCRRWRRSHGGGTVRRSTRGTCYREICRRSCGDGPHRCRWRTRRTCCGRARGRSQHDAARRSGCARATRRTFPDVTGP